MTTLARIPFTTPPVTWNNGRYDVALGVVPLTWLRPAAYNPRSMSDDARARLERSANVFGLVDALVAAEDGELLGGHQRRISEERRGATEVPVFVVFGLDAAQRRTVNVLLNNPNAQGQWDMPGLTALLSDLDGEGADATLTGFSEQELERMLTNEPPATDDTADVRSDDDGDEYVVTVTCRSAEEQKATYDRLLAAGYTCKAVAP